MILTFIWKMFASVSATEIEGRSLIRLTPTSPAARSIIAGGNFRKDHHLTFAMLPFRRKSIQ